jgi:hypothetical protein
MVSDIRSNQPWQTALHKAVEDGDLDLARTLLRLGADPDVKDTRFASTPLGWARCRLRLERLHRGDRSEYPLGDGAARCPVAEHRQGHEVAGGALGAPDGPLTVRCPR